MGDQWRMMVSMQTVLLRRQGCHMLALTTNQPLGEWIRSFFRRLDKADEFRDLVSQRLNLSDAALSRSLHSCAFVYTGCSLQRLLCSEAQGAVALGKMIHAEALLQVALEDPDAVGYGGEVDTVSLAMLAWHLRVNELFASPERFLCLSQPVFMTVLPSCAINLMQADQGRPLRFPMLAA